RAPSGAKPAPTSDPEPALPIGGRRASAGSTEPCSCRRPDAPLTEYRKAHWDPRESRRCLSSASHSGTETTHGRKRKAAPGSLPSASFPPCAGEGQRGLLSVPKILFRHSTEPGLHRQSVLGEGRVELPFQLWIHLDHRFSTWTDRHGALI